MAILEIKIQDKIIDLYDEEKIVQSFSLINIEDITKRESEYSNTFKVPRTNNNLQALDYIDFLNSNSLLPYSRLNCEILIDGFLFKKGFISVESIEEDITLQFFTGNAGFYEIIKTKDLSDINTDNTPSLETTWNLTNVIAKRAASEGIFFPMVDYNGMPTGTTTVDVRLLLPAFYRKTLMEAIVEDAGYTLINNVNTSLDAYNHDIIPTATNKLYNDQDTIDESRYKANRSYAQANGTRIIQSTLPYFQNIQLDYNNFNIQFIFANLIVGNANHYNASSQNYGSYYRSNYSGDFNFEFYFNSTYTNKLNFLNTGGSQYPGTVTVPIFTANYKIEWWVTVNNIQIKKFHETNYSYTNSSLIPNGTGNIDIIESEAFTENFVVRLNQGDIVKIYPRLILTLYSNAPEEFLNSRLVSQFNIRLASNSYIDIFLTENLAFNGIVNPNNCLTNIKQSEFFKDTLIRYCLVPIVDEDNKKVTLFEFSKIKDNINNAVDWSGKLDETNESELTFKIDSYGQNNYLNHKEDKFVLQLPQGSNGIITIANQNLELKKDLYESPFAASETVSRLNGRKVMYIDLHDGVSLTTTESFKNDVQARTGYTAKSNFTVTYTDGTTSTVVSSDIPLTWFIDTSKNYNAGFQYLLDNSIDLIAILQNLKVVKADIRLNILDIINLNYFYPIYIAEFNSYFFLSKINQFDYTSNESTKVELIKLN